jgi:hypothetical protein
MGLLGNAKFKIGRYLKVINVSNLQEEINFGCAHNILQVE